MKTTTRSRNIRQEMDQFFQVADAGADPYEESRKVNQILVNMTPQQLSETCQRYGLEPIRRYLNTRTIMKRNEFRGYARCLDIWLLQETGGERTRLIGVGKRLTGRKPTARNGRLLRLEIACIYFGQFFEEKAF